MGMPGHGGARREAGERGGSRRGEEQVAPSRGHGGVRVRLQSKA